LTSYGIIDAYFIWLLVEPSNFIMHYFYISTFAFLYLNIGCCGYYYYYFFFSFYFVVCTAQFVVMFTGGDSSGKSKYSCNAYISQSTQGLRSLLREHVSYSY